MGLKCSDSPDSCFREHGENKFNENIYISWKKWKKLNSAQVAVGRNKLHIMVNLWTHWNFITVDLLIARHHPLKPIAVIQNMNSSPYAVKWQLHEPTHCKKNCADVLSQGKAEDYGGKKKRGLTVVQNVFFYNYVLPVFKLPPPDHFLPTSPGCLKLFSNVSASHMITYLWG